MSDLDDLDDIAQQCSLAQNVGHKDGRARRAYQHHLMLLKRMRQPSLHKLAAYARQRKVPITLAGSARPSSSESS